MKCITTNMKNNYGKLINRSFILLLALTIFICSAMLFLCNLEKNKVYADYNDILNDPDAIVNFNQLIASSYNSPFTYNTGYITATTTANTDYTISNIGLLNQGHKYYLRFKDGIGFYYIQLTNNTDYSLTGEVNWHGGNYDNIYICNNANRNFYFTCNTSSNTFKISIILIDLSLMFGVGNEPTLDQCREIFVSDYYTYTSGTPMSINSFNGYTQALQDIFSSYKYQLSMNALTLSTYSVNYKNEDSSFAYNDENNNWYFVNTFAVPLFTTINAGATINIDYRFYVYDLSQAWYLNVMIYNGNDYITIYTSPEQVDTANPQNMSFTLPLDTDTLYFNIVYNNQILTDANAIVFKFNVSANQLDINSMIYNAFLSGQNDMARQYQIGGERYNAIYRQGVADAESNGSVFDSSWAFVASAFSGVGELLSTELMPNVPIGLFVALPLLLGLIFFIVKLTKGGS